jgi:hypothetical protein
MAPEQIQGGQVTPAMDVYALGIVAYEMFAGRPPFQGNISAIFEGHLLRRPPPIEQRNPAIPEKAQAVIFKALEKLPSERYPQASTFVDDLKAADETAAGIQPPAQPEIPAAVQPDHSSSSKSAPKPKRSNRFRFGIAGISSVVIVGLICACAAIGLYFFRDQVISLINTSANSTDTPNILYLTDFETSVSPNFPIDQQSQGGLSFSEGGYRIQVDAADWSYWGMIERNFGNVTIEVTATQLGGPEDNEIGILCRAANLNEFYYGVVTSTGSYWIGHKTATEFQILTDIPTQGSAAINRGNEQNTIRLDCDANDIRLYANSILLAEVNGILETPAGRIGLLAASHQEGGVDILFDNFIVTDAR